MEDNPYRSPEAPPANTQVRLKKQRSGWGYLLAVILGLTCITPVLMPPLAILDDTGLLQMLIAAFMGPVLYHFLWPHPTINEDAVC